MNSIICNNKFTMGSSSRIDFDDKSGKQSGFDMFLGRVCTSSSNNAMLAMLAYAPESNTRITVSDDEYNSYMNTHKPETINGFALNDRIFRLTTPRAIDLKYSDGYWSYYDDELDVFVYEKEYDMAVEVYKELLAELWECYVDIDIEMLHESAIPLRKMIQNMCVEI